MVPTGGGIHNNLVIILTVLQEGTFVSYHYRALSRLMNDGESSGTLSTAKEYPAHTRSTKIRSGKASELYQTINRLSFTADKPIRRNRANALDGFLPLIRNSNVNQANGGSV